ncbi:hypothetical protein ABZ454_00545 [Streptomyces sp. NPDC005803]|uniref:hypothetical protein n=1 Tax=Streptomyces sp. NPDC005803 TaxID=3154297 RepID=UPI0033F12474
MTAPGPRDGVLTAASPQGVWAWVAVRLAPAAALDAHRGYADVPEEQRRTQAAGQELAWLEALLASGPGIRFELRLRNDPSARLLRGALLGQARGADHDAAVRAALALRDRLTAAPRHVRAEPVSDTDEVRDWLAPFTPHPDGLAELRKPLAHAPCARRDTGRTDSFAVSPLRWAAHSREPFWAELGRLPYPAVAGVCLEPYTVPQDVRHAFRALADEYARLAAPGSVRPTWNVAAPPDVFAGQALPLLQDAVRRYAGRAYRSRVSLACAEALPPGLAEQFAAAAGGAVVCRPPAREWAAAWANTAGLNRNRLPLTYAQGAPAHALNPVEWLLTDLLDASEAAAAFRLPYEVPGHHPLFAAPGRVPGPRPAEPGPAPARQPVPPGGDPGAPRFDG